MKNRVIAFIAAWLATFVLASLAHSQMVLNELQALGINISAGLRFESSLNDMLGLAPAYGAVILIALLLGFSVTGFLFKRAAKQNKTLSFWLYPISGFVAILVVHILMHPLLDITLIAGARTTLGLILQCLAGLVGGLIFVKLKSTKAV